MSHYQAPAEYPWRYRPAQYVRPFGNGFPGIWVQDGVPVRPKKEHAHFVWPKDGRTGGKWDRFKDILTGKGPDMFVTVGAQKMDYMFHRPRKARWAVHRSLDDRGPDSFVGNRKGVPPREYQEKAYDFRTRKYRRLYEYMWTDAIWDPKQDTDWPEYVRDIWGEWWAH